MLAAQENARDKKEITNDKKEEIVPKTIYRKTKLNTKKKRNTLGNRYYTEKIPPYYTPRRK
jgi:hypothetical protein